MTGRDAVAASLRRGLTALTALGLAGTLVELATLRHWDGPREVIPWVVLVVSGGALLALVARPGPATVRAARLTALALALAGVVGVAIHVLANLESAPLDGVVGPTWDSFPLWRQIWMASTGGVGPAPPLAAGALAPTGLAMALATVGHPAGARPGAAQAPAAGRAR